MCENYAQLRRIAHIAVALSQAHPTAHHLVAFPAKSAHYHQLYGLSPGPLES